MRKYAELEDLMCLGCHPYESLFVDTENKIINICYSFALRFWNTTEKALLEKPTTRFDNCGFKASDALKEYFKDNLLTYIIPSQKISSFKEFIKAIKIPFFEEYDINLMEEDNTTQKCFSSSLFNKINYHWILLLLLVILSI